MGLRSPPQNLMPGHLKDARRRVVKRASHSRKARSS
jgi:hypothetical protein